jgi:hypothetical protein
MLAAIFVAIIGQLAEITSFSNNWAFALIFSRFYFSFSFFCKNVSLLIK